MCADAAEAGKGQEELAMLAGVLRGGAPKRLSFLSTFLFRKRKVD